MRGIVRVEGSLGRSCFDRVQPSHPERLLDICDLREHVFQTVAVEPPASSDSYPSRKTPCVSTVMLNPSTARA
jgi:hypothetical protein